MGARQQTVWTAGVVMILACAGAARAAEATTPAPEKASLALPDAREVEPQPWYGPLKNMKIGPGTLSIDGQLRVRWEHYNDYTIRRYNQDEHDDVVLMRTWVGFDYKFAKEAHAYVMFQDARSYVSDLNRDQFPLTSPYFDQADVRKAYVEWKHVGGSPLGFKIGRQALDYGDRRLMGPSNWGNVGGFWWDAAKLYIDTAPVQVDLFFGQRVIREQIRWDNRHFDFDAMGAYAQFKNLPCKFDVFYILRYDDHGNAVGERGNGDIRRHTVGTYVSGEFLKRWDYAGTLAAQFGTQGGDDVEAYAANARLGHTWLDRTWKPRVAGEFSYASGDRNPGDGLNQTFDNLFTAPTMTYGRMNLLSWQNMMDYQATFEVKPARNLKVSVDYHYFTLASDTDAWYWFNMTPQRRDRTGGSGHEIGQEVDIQIKWTVSKNFELFAGYSFFCPGSFVRNTPGGDDNANWGFLQCTYKF